MTTAVDLGTLLEESLIAALETMCFVSVMSPDAPPFNPALGARVVFNGDAKGILQVAVTADAAENIAGSFTGEDAADLTKEQIEGVISEIVNVICGSMLSAYKPDGHFALDTPVPVFEDFEYATLCKSYELETGFLTLQLQFSDSAQ